MKKLGIALIFAFSLASCHSSTGPATSDPAVMPPAGSQYVYRVDKPASNSGSAVQLNETATIALQAPDIFVVSRLSDTIGGFSTTSIGETYQLQTSNDLRPLTPDTCCDMTALPIATHNSFDSRTASFPTKNNGVEADGFVAWHTQYDGQEIITAAGQTFACTKVEKSVSVSASSGDPNYPIKTVTVTHIYWYSSDIKFFVKDQFISNDTASYTRTLVSYK